MQGKSNTQGKRLQRGRCLLGVIFILMVWTIAFPQKADAAVLGKDIREGDVISLEAGSWSENYAVLIPDTTNIGTEGTFLMMDGFKEKIMHDETGRSNLWEGSTSQQWCTNYYRKLPDAVSSKIIGVKTTDTESGSQWLVVNNIDGTKTDKDKVFFLSGKEYLEHTEAADHSKGYNWLLRSPGSDCSVYADYIGVACNGLIHNFSIEHVMAARPAFNIRLPHDVCVKARTEEDGTTVWTVDAEAMEHRQDTASYTWSKDGKECLAEAKCSRCGEAVRESGEVKSQVIKEPSEKTDGIIRYTATFQNDAFTEQTTELPLAWADFKDDTEETLEPEKPVIKSGTEVEAGDYVFMGEKNPNGYSGMPYWKVLSKEKDGTVLLMSEYLWRGNGNEAATPPAFNLHRSDGNEWQSSLARKWCGDFERLGQTPGRLAVDDAEVDRLGAGALCRCHLGRRHAEDLRGRLAMEVLPAQERLDEALVARQVRKQPQLDLRVVARQDDVVGTGGHKGRPHHAAQVAAHGDVLQVGVRGG